MVEGVGIEAGLQDSIDRCCFCGSAEVLISWLTLITQTEPQTNVRSFSTYLVL